MKEKIINFLKNHYWKLIIWIVLFTLPILYFANVGWKFDSIKNKYYKWRITTNFKNYINKNNYKFFSKEFKFKDKLSNNFTVDSIKNNQCERLFKEEQTEYRLYAYKINKCFNSGDFYVFKWKLLVLENSVDSWENTIYSIDKWINYNIVKSKQWKILYKLSWNSFKNLNPQKYKFIKNIWNNFYILSENNRKKLFYLDKEGKSDNLIDLADLEKSIDKTYFYKSWDIYEISLKYKNSTKWTKIIFDTKTAKVKNQIDLQYIACDDKTQKCWDDFADKIKELKFKNLVWAKILKWNFKTGAIESIQIELSWWNCINKTYQITWDLLTGVNYTFPIKITWTWNCTQLLAKVILKWKDKKEYKKDFNLTSYLLVKKYNSNIWVFTVEKWDAYGLYYFSWDEIQNNNPYLIKVVRNSENLDYKYLPQIYVYWTWEKYIIWMIYSWKDYGEIISFDAKNLSKEVEKVEKKYFRCNEKTNRCYDDFKEKVVSLWVKNLVNKALVSWIFKEWTMKSASIVLSGCINKTYQITWSLYSGINYTFPIKVKSKSKCKKIKWIINLTWTNNISYPKKFELYSPFFVNSLWDNLYKLWDWNDIFLAYAKQNLRKNIKLISLKNNSKIYLYISWDVYHIWITYSWTNIWQIIDFDTKNEKILKNEKANYIVCDKETNWCYDQFKDIVDDIIVDKNSFWWNIIWILKEWKVKKVIVQPIESKDCDIDTSPYELKKFYAWNIFFKYNFALKYKNICSNWWKFKIILEWFDWKKYETTISVVWDFYDDRYKPEKFVLLKKVCKAWDKWWWWNDNYNNWFSTDVACYYGFFTTKWWKVWIYQIEDDGMWWPWLYLTTNINISNNKNNYNTNNLSYTLLNTFFNIDKYNWIVSYYDDNYEINENFEFKKLDDSFDVLNYSWFNFYKQGKQFYIKAPTQNILLPVEIKLGCKNWICKNLNDFNWIRSSNLTNFIRYKKNNVVIYIKNKKYYILDKNLENGKYLMPVNINLDCKWVFCPDLTKFDWTKVDDPNLIKHKWKNITIYEKKGKYYILDKKLENGIYLMSINIYLDKFFNGSINIWWVDYDTIGSTEKLDDHFKYIKTVQTEDWKYKIYENNWNYYIDGWNWFLQNFVIKLALNSTSNNNWIIKFNKENLDHAGNYTIWPDNYDEYNITIEDNINLKDLEQIWTWLKSPVYRIKKANNEILKQFYCSRYSEYNKNGKPICNTNNEKYKTFVANDPILVWKDPLGRYIRMTDIQYVPQAEKAKPVIYLYPTKKQNTSVKIWLNWRFLTTIPKYKNWWNVVAYPNWNIVSNWKTYPYLYRDGIDKNYTPPKKWFIIKNSKRKIWLFLQMILSQIWLNKQEKQDFIEYWLPILYKVKWKYIFIWFKLTENLGKETPLFIDPKPDSLLRIFMDYHWLNDFEKVEKPKITTFERKWFTVVEWWWRKY